MPDAAPAATRTLAVLGATGRTGRFVVDEALDRGWRVNALVRNRADVLDAWKRSGRVGFVQGDATDARAVNAVVDGADAVSVLLAHVPGAPPNLLEETARHVVAAMRAHGVKRVLATTPASVRAPDDAPTLRQRAQAAVRARLRPAGLADAQRHVAVYRESGLEWTVARAPRLTDKPGTRNVRVGAVGKDMKPFLPRADFARFIVDAIESGEYVHAMPVVSARPLGRA